MSGSDGLVATAAAGDRLATLRALRDVLAGQIEGCDSGRDLAALSRQLTQVLGEIDGLKPPAKVKETPLDELRNRRTARGTGASRPTRTARGRK